MSPSCLCVQPVFLVSYHLICLHLLMSIIPQVFVYDPSSSCPTISFVSPQVICQKSLSIVCLLLVLRIDLMPLYNISLPHVFVFSLSPLRFMSLWFCLCLNVLESLSCSFCLCFHVFVSTPTFLWLCPWVFVSLSSCLVSLPSFHGAFNSLSYCAVYCSSCPHISASSFLCFLSPCLLRYDPAEMLCAVFWENSYSDMLVYILCAFSVCIFIPFIVIIVTSLLSMCSCGYTCCRWVIL